MERDMDLVRKILLHLETDQSPGPKLDLEIEGYDSLSVKYHLNLLYEAGLITAEPMMSSTSSRVIEVIPFALSWEGHEFLDAARDNSVWEGAKKKLAGAASTVPFTVMKELLVAALRGQLNL